MNLIIQNIHESIFLRNYQKKSKTAEISVTLFINSYRTFHLIVHIMRDHFLKKIEYHYFQ